MAAVNRPTDHRLEAGGDQPGDAGPCRTRRGDHRPRLRVRDLRHAHGAVDGPVPRCAGRMRVRVPDAQGPSRPARSRGRPASWRTVRCCTLRSRSSATAIRRARERSGRRRTTRSRTTAPGSASCSGPRLRGWRRHDLRNLRIDIRVDSREPAERTSSASAGASRSRRWGQAAGILGERGIAIEAGQYVSTGRGDRSPTCRPARWARSTSHLSPDGFDWHRERCRPARRSERGAGALAGPGVAGVPR